MANERFIKDGESILVVDAGGGTVDLCLLKVVNAEKNRVNLGELQPTRGDNYGATFIDRAFEDLVKTRLLGLDHMFITSISDVAWLMKSDPDYLQNKHELGANTYNKNSKFRIGLPERIQRFTNESRLIADGQMLFTWRELEQLFDPQVKGILSLLDEMVMKHEKRTDSKRIDHVVLSGGLGRSKYVFKQLEEYVSSSRSAALKGTKVHQSSDPQLCVCLGIVESAMQTIENDTNMFQRRISKVSLEASKNDLVTEKDPEGHRWIRGYMDWFILRGDGIQDNKAAKHPYSIDFGPDVSTLNRIGRVLIKSCTSEPIPSFDKDERVRNNTVLTVDLSHASIGSIEERKPKGLFGKNLGVRIRFYVEARIGMADVSFRAPPFERERLS
ncbi:uncharacterized protein J7T54_003287 [Emericellopsis cladophorae]|uniref:Uncharacterized protein n=1 Tax=Emericellopsis cladophorae TaxID=2686198 RepID=A0A9P9Y055_9HYPO|nr:uncharacterized protein J7T54_003287 [Emericellopsis cladophorae]KAI6781119.1 hypothetical protein J7T54_003287 [Emericellopsis cladophorae]